MRHLATLLAALLAITASLSVPAAPAQAKTCLSEITVASDGKFGFILTAEASMSYVEFAGMENMQITLPGEKTTRVEDFGWKLPTNTKKVNFRAEHYDTGLELFAAVIIYDQCDQIFWFLIGNPATTVFRQYPYQPFTQPRARAIQPIKAPAQVPPRTQR